MARSEWTQIRVRSAARGYSPRPSGAAGRSAMDARTANGNLVHFQGDDAASPAKVELHHSKAEVHHLVSARRQIQWADGACAG